MTELLWLAPFALRQIQKSKTYFRQNLSAKIFTKRYFRATDDNFDEVVEEDKPIIPQTQELATKNGLNLEPGWKVEIA
ncbi:hypothetical protein PI95_033945 [Hassallia byssoidea VB512170]|uniref:Uncharacterized protein n=1 Tax=Hassallia byssoidea VB512170 TaxID=1304833 RepID=A0A846HLC5_9CYAN|nr:hypothetical protein [Hassalia byssoidea]NEU77348.1 hypothetical protein [Hassalia byssoidea VB512170]